MLDFPSTDINHPRPSQSDRWIAKNGLSANLNVNWKSHFPSLTVLTTDRNNKTSKDTNPDKRAKLD